MNQLFLIFLILKGYLSKNLFKEVNVLQSISRIIIFKKQKFWLNYKFCILNEKTENKKCVKMDLDTILL